VIGEETSKVAAGGEAVFSDLRALFRSSRAMPPSEHFSSKGYSAIKDFLGVWEAGKKVAADQKKLASGAKARTEFQ
jgi:hypothetical protein